MERVNSGTATPPSLLLRLRNIGDVTAWETFVEIYGSLVYSESRRRGLSHADSEDVTQRVFARIIVGIRKLLTVHQNP